MNLAKTIVVRELISSLSLIKKSPFYLVVAAFVDALFFVAYGFFTTPISDRIAMQSILIANEISQLLAEGKAGILKLLFQEPLLPMTGKLIILMLLLFVITYIVYVIFQGTSWYLAGFIAQQKLSYRKYLLGFARVNLIWIACYIVYKLVDIILGLRFVIIKQFVPDATNVAGNILFGLFVVVIIAACLSYARLEALTIFKTPLKIMLPLLALSFIIYLNAQFVINLISKLNSDLGFIAGLIILFPVIIFIKIYMTRVLNVRPQR